MISIIRAALALAKYPALAAGVIALAIFF